MTNILVSTAFPFLDHFLLSKYIMIKRSAVCYKVEYDLACLSKLESVVAEGDNRSSKATMSPYEEAMDALSSLITARIRADRSNKGDQFDVMFDYLKVILYYVREYYMSCG